MMTQNEVITWIRKNYIWVVICLGIIVFGLLSAGIRVDPRLISSCFLGLECLGAIQLGREVDVDFNCVPLCLCLFVPSYNVFAIIRCGSPTFSCWGPATLYPSFL